MSRPRLDQNAQGCVREGCGQEVKARGLCERHYKAWQREKNPKARVGVSTVYRRSETAVEHGGSGGTLGRAQKPMEERDPERSAEAIGQLTELARFQEAGKAAGMSEGLVQAISKRLSTRFVGPKLQLENLKSGELIDALDGKIALALHYLDPYAMEGASGKDLAIILGILIEKRQLLKGEPTQILTVNERSALDDLIPEVLAEARRRGNTLELQADEDGVFVPTGLASNGVPNVFSGGLRKRLKEGIETDGAEP